MNTFALPALTLVALLAINGCSKKKATGTVVEDRFTVRSVDIRDVISQTGTVQPVVKVELKSEASGKIEKIPVREGQSVKKGDTILTIDPSRLLTQKEKLELNLRRSRIDLQIAERDLANAETLFKTGSVPEKRLQDLTLARDLAFINTQQQQLELRDVSDQLSKTIVRSPMDGVITLLPVKEGEIAVSATSGFQSGTAIATIADITRLEVITSIGEIDYVHLKAGQKVSIRSEAIEKARTHGTIDFISLSARKNSNEELGSFEVRISIDSIIPGIAPGINVNVEFIILDIKNTPGIPYHFAKRRGEKAFVDLVKNDSNGKETISAVPVELGPTDYRYIQILSGLNEGDVIYFRQTDRSEGQPAGARGGAQRGGRR